MKKLFNHILVPVCFNRNTSLVLGKAAQVANRFDCDIHLLHVQHPGLAIPFVYDGSISGAASGYSAEEAEKKLKELASEIKPSLADGLLVTTTVIAGNWYNMIKEQVITRHIDLVIISRDERRFPGAVLYRIDVSQLAQQTQCPVLTVTEGFDADQLQNIVVPVDDFLPIKKLTAATYLARRFNAVIHLMSSRGETDEEKKRKAGSLARAYQLLNDYTNVKVYCSAQQGHTTADDALAYAQDVKADLIVLNSGRESLLKGWFSRWLRKYVYKKSDIPVLTISPG